MKILRRWTPEEESRLVKRAYELARLVSEGKCSNPSSILAEEFNRSSSSIHHKMCRLRSTGVDIPDFQTFRKMSSHGLTGLLKEDRDKALSIEEIKTLKTVLRAGASKFHFIELLKDIVPSYDFKPPPYPVKKKKKKVKDLDEEDFVIIISDIHGGMLIDKKDTGGIGEYNIEILKRRYNQFKKAIEKIIRIEGRNRPIKRVWLFYLGDIVEGHDIFTGQPYHLDMNAAESTFLLAKMFSEFEIFLSFFVPEVRTVEIVGNHGVPGGKKAGALPLKMNFDWIFYKVKEIMTQNYPNIIHKIAESWFQLVDVRGHYFLLIHGEDFRTTLRIPYYGIDRAYGNYMDLLKVPFTYFLLGHFHAAASLPGSGYSEKIINGCWPGGGGLTKKIQVASLPEQWMFGVHPRQGITFRYKIKLIDPKDMLFPELDIYTAEEK